MSEKVSAGRPLFAGHCKYSFYRQILEDQFGGSLRRLCLWKDIAWSSLQLEITKPCRTINSSLTGLWSL